LKFESDLIISLSPILLLIQVYFGYYRPCCDKSYIILKKNAIDFNQIHSKTRMYLAERSKANT